MPLRRLNSLDLNLLSVFDAVMQERSVTRAAQRIGSSQPAVSSALKKLREHLDDELFVRTSEGVIPTARAVEISGPVRRALIELQGAFEPGEFRPDMAEHRFTIALEDYSQAVLFPTLAARLQQEAPKIRVYARSGGQSAAVRMLDQAEADFAIGVYGGLPDRLETRDLFDESYVCIVRAGHPAADEQLTLETFTALPHLLVSLSGPPRGFIDDLLEKRGLERKVSMVVDNFLAAPPIVAASDMVATMPRRLVDASLARSSLRIFEPPLETPEATIQLIWLRRRGRHPAVEWFTELLIGVGREESRRY
jgi:DNA-binding transcriptional LysR family regulator